MAVPMAFPISNNVLINFAIAFSKVPEIVDPPYIWNNSSLFKINILSPSY